MSHTKIYWLHYSDVIRGAIGCQIISPTIVYSTVYSGADLRKHQSSAWLALVRGIHQWLENSPHKGPVTRKMFPVDDVIMNGLAIETQQEIYAKNVYRRNHLTVFSSMKIIVRRLKFHWILFQRSLVDKAGWQAINVFNIN